jgi:aspartyl-tRNA(Asn)/glutamyl-tRNA(Gln) amidotransferase subunit C
MTVNIDKIAKSAAIALTEEEKALLKDQVEGIVNMLNQLNTVNTSGVEPLMTVFDGELPLRTDIAIDPHSDENVMKSANNSKYGYFVTPKFVD